ncbi:MAG: PAS domain S-box protein [Chromatiaceae bacterium]|nr:PAS domain S-box protein [Chromatiaceae bacterium]
MTQSEGWGTASGGAATPPRMGRDYGSPLRVVLIVGALVFVAELLVMAVLFPHPAVEATLGRALLDSAILFVLVSPAIYLLLFRPLGLSLAAWQRAEADLRLERDQLKGILDAMPDGVCVTSAAQRIEYGNPVLVGTFGPIEGKSCREYFRCTVDTCPSPAGQPIGHGCRLWSVSQTGRVYEVFTTPVRAADGALARLEILRDVTEQRAAQAALAESEHRYRSLMEEASDAIALLDRERRIVDLNPEACRVLGYARHELLGQVVTDLVSEDDLARDPPRSPRLVAGEHLLVQRRIRRRDGSLLPVEVNIKRLADGRFLAIARDLSERYRAEAAVRTARDFYFKLLDEFPIPVWRCRTDGRYEGFNKAWLDFTGQTLRQALDGGLAQHVHPDDRGLVLTAYRRAFRDLSAFQVEYRLRYRSGDYRWVVDSGRPYTDLDKRFDQRLSGFIGCCYDVTARNRALADLAASEQRLRALSSHLQRAREEERAAVSREIHDELGQVLTALKYDLATLDWDTDDAATRAERIGAMDASLDQAIKTVQRLCSELRPGILDDLGLEAAIEWLIGQFQRRAKVTCELRVEPEEIEVDGERATAIFRIVQEALTNVARHARATRVGVNLEAEDAGMLLTVWDDGVGLPPGRADALDAFGLMGIRERARDLGGRAEIGDRPGGGTRLRVHIPWQEAL